jgi:hypothetical protein
MQLTKETQEKLRKYIINSDPFLFGMLKAKNKKSRMIELKEMGFLQSYSLGSNPNYSRFYQDLTVEIGVKGILDRHYPQSPGVIYPGCAGVLAPLLGAGVASFAGLS